MLDDTPLQHRWVGIHMLDDLHCSKAEWEFNTSSILRGIALFVMDPGAISCLDHTSGSVFLFCFRSLAASPGNTIFSVKVPHLLDYLQSLCIHNLRSASCFPFWKPAAVKFFGVVILPEIEWVLRNGKQAARLIQYLHILFCTQRCTLETHTRPVCRVWQNR